VSFAACGEARDMKFATTQEAEVYKDPRPAAAPPLFQRFFRFPLPWVMVVFPRWLMGGFRCLDSFSTSIKLTNCSIVMAS